MKRLLLAITLAASSLPVFAAESGELWFYDGTPWYAHPCGLRAFAKYGHEKTPAIWQAYLITRRDPSQCEKLFP